MSKKITIELSAANQVYFDEIKSTLDSSTHKKSTDTEVAEYVFTALSFIEKIVGDPVDFIADIAEGRKLIVPVSERKQKCTCKPNQETDPFCPIHFVEQ